jgi:hypothetical protein
MSTDNLQDNPISLDDLNYFWMSNGAPCFMADRENICDIVESFGFQVYYLIADLQNEKLVDGKDAQNKPIKYSVLEKRATVLKVVNNIIGRSVSETDDEFGSDVLSSVPEEAYYSMPKIPRALIDKLDEFFRLIHAQHGTESIVILTFDPNKNDSSGWGVLVPEQTNTSVHCKYDADSIASLKPDHVLIVGSVHSHPEMSAYASGTDHADQADFDGIHITYGWQKTVNNGATQYHAEMQLAGTAYKLDIEDVFEFVSKSKDPDPEVVEWSEKVKKALPPYQHTGVTPAQHTNSPTLPAYTPATEFGPRATQYIPFDLPNHDAQIVLEMVEGKKPWHCKSCEYLILDEDVHEKGYCPSCDIPIVSSSASILEIELMVEDYLTKRGLDTKVAYYLWCTDEQDSNFLIQVKADDLDSRPYANGSRVDVDLISDADEYEAGVSLLDSSNPFVYNSDLTICCLTPADKAWVDCDCQPTVYFEDIEMFEDATKHLSLYEEDSICHSCAYYHLPECESYRNSLINFVETRELPSAKFSGCDDWIDFTKVSSDIDSGVYEYYN